MSRYLHWIAAGWLLIPACVPPTSSGSATRAGTRRTGADLFTTEGMTEAIVEIEAALGSEHIRPLQQRYEKAYRSDPKHPFKRFLWAYTLDDRNEAWGELTKVTKLNDRFYWAYLGMAVILDEWKVDDQAERSFLTALKLDSDIAIGYGRFGRMYLRKGDVAKALPLLEKAVEMDPSRVIYRLNLARTLDKSGQLKRATDIYTQALELAPSSFEAAAELANLINRTGDKAAAVEAYQRAAELNAKAYTVRFKRANLLMELGRNDEALPALGETCDLKPGEQSCWQTLARVAGDMDKKDDRIAAFEHVIRLDPENLEANGYLGPVYLEAGEIEKALPAFQAVLSKDKDNQDVLAGLATIYEQGEEFSRAIEFNERLTALSPGNASAREALERLFKRFHIVTERFSGDKPDDVFARNREQIAKVYRMRLERRSRMSGDMHLKVTVTNEGKVTDVVMVKNTVGDQVIDLCAFWNLRRSKFPSGFGATYDFELTLKPGE